MTTENHEKLPESECFEESGHVTDVVLTCLADGESAILPAAAELHVDACDACTTRLGVEALLSVNASSALLASTEARAPLRIVAATPALPAGRAAMSLSPSSRRRRPLPMGAIAAALLIAAVGALPGLTDTLDTLRTVVPDLLHALPICLRAIEAVIRSMMQSRSTTVLRWIIAAAFIGVGTLLARSMTRRRSLEGGLG